MTIDEARNALVDALFSWDSSRPGTPAETAWIAKVCPAIDSLVAAVRADEQAANAELRELCGKVAPKMSAYAMVMDVHHWQGVEQAKTLAVQLESAARRAGK